MKDSMVSENTSGGIRGTIAVALARVVVPLWLLTGAVLKLMDMSPAHLPAAMIKWCGALDVDLMFVLRFTIAAELIVAGVMVLLPPLARWVGVAMLLTFVPVLIGDLMMGASSCGCFGAVKVSPWVTFVMDVTFLIGLIFLGRREPRLALTSSLPTSRVLIAGLWSLLCVAVAFGSGTPAPRSKSVPFYDPAGAPAGRSPGPELFAAASGGGSKGRDLGRYRIGRDVAALEPRHDGSARSAYPCPCSL